jgi:hypothetical protein
MPSGPLPGSGRAWHDGRVRVRSSGWVGLALVVMLVTGGCAGSPTPAPSGNDGETAAPSATGASAEPEQPAEPEVLMEIMQLRGDVASGHIELRVTNDSDASLRVVRATYESSRWSAPMVRDDEAEIAPGQRRNLRLELPEPTCDWPAPIEHLATLELADGTVLEQQPADPLDQLEWLGQEICDLRLFEQEVAGLTWLEPSIPADGSGPAVLRLQVDPVQEPSEQRGWIGAVTATALLTPVDASGTRVEDLPLDLTISRGDRPTVLEVPLEPGRCDLHAIAEDKQGTIFRLPSMMGGEPIALVLASPDAQREALLDWAVARCAAQP